MNSDQYYDWKGNQLDPAIFGREGSFYPVLASKYSLTYDNVRGQVGKVIKKHGSTYDKKPKLVFTEPKFRYLNCGLKIR